MASTTPLMFAIVTVSVAFAGCTESFPTDSGTDSESPDADIQFDGSGDGSQSDSANCDADVVLEGSTDVNDGVLTITVTDGSGTERFSNEYDGSDSMSGRTLPGDSGTWTVNAERSGDDAIGGDEFHGAYEFFLTC